MRIPEAAAGAKRFVEYTLSMPFLVRTTRRAFLAAAATPLLAAKPQRLFDGRTLDGWTLHAGGVWTVEDGAIVGRFDRTRPGAGYLMTAHEYQDFVFALEFWVDKAGNSGVFIREPRREWTNRGNGRPAQGDHGGYEVQIQYADPTQPTGMIYGRQVPEKVLGGEERWVPMEIECRGEITTVRVEGQVVNVYRETRVQKGVIGLQIHGGRPHDHIVKFRNVRITV